ncbi:MAG: PA0069 family radical SAM protein [Acidobacteriota bacterium]
MARSPAGRRAAKGRGAVINPKGRFERLDVLTDGDYADPSPDDLEDPRAARPATAFSSDASKSVISRNQSPDIPFSVSLNPYRGCEHGCSYCYARASHEFLGFSAGLDFETKIVVKEDAPELMRREITGPKWRPQTLALSGVTDAYQPVERRLEVTRRCLEILAELRHPVSIITKNALVARDVDLLAGLAEHGAASVALSITTLDPDLSRRLEPRASSPRRRLDAVRTLADAGVPVGVMTAPIIPGLNDHEPAAILEAAADAGATFAGYTVLRLPGVVAELFDAWLHEHVPDRAPKVLNLLRTMRGGRLYDPRFGRRMTGQGPYYQQLKALFHIASRRHGLARGGPGLSTDAFRPPGAQLGLFGS